VAFNVRRYIANKLSYEALVEIQNFGAEPENVKLSLYAGDEAIDVKPPVTLAPGERKREIYPDLGGGSNRVLRAVVEPVHRSGHPRPDASPLDDTAYALLPEQKRQRVLLVAESDLYIEAALDDDANLVVTVLKPAKYEEMNAAKTLGPYDA